MRGTLNNEGARWLPPARSPHGRWARHMPGATDNAGNVTTVTHTYRVTLLGLGVGPL